MKLQRSRSSTIALLLFACALLHSQTGSAASPPPAPSITITLEQYLGRLHQVSEAVSGTDPAMDQMRRLLIEVPEKYTVTTAGGSIEVNNDWLRNALAKLALKGQTKREQSLAALRQALAAHIATVEKAQGGNKERMVQADAMAASILSGPEFSHVKKPDLWAIWLERVFQRLGRWLDSLSERTGRVPWLGRSIVWLVIALSTAIFAVWLYRTLRRTAAEMPMRVPIPFTGERKSWLKWLRDAAAAAEHGDFREAVHCAYWAAIARLEEAGSWRIDRTRTPREYLALLHASHPVRRDLDEVTQRFEVIWYGNRPARSGDFDFMRSRVEGMAAR
jgi:hypothetical protein